MRSSLRSIAMSLAVAAPLLAVAVIVAAYVHQRVLPVGAARLAPTTSAGERRIAWAYATLERYYYKPLDPVAVERSERAALLALVRTRVHTATLPAIPSGDPPDVVASLERQLADAERSYGAALGPGGDQRLADAALRGIMAAQHDPYTVYLSPAEYRGLNEMIDGGDFGGIGVYIEPWHDGIVVQPIAASPAARAGIKPGDIIERVNGVSVHGLSLERVKQLIRGAPGTLVRLTVHPFDRPRAVRTVAIVREIIHVPTVYAEMTHGYDYIRLADFGETSPQEVRRALLDGIHRHAKGFILDLRDDGGGLLSAAVQISSYFIPHGPIVSTITRDGSREVEEATGTAIGGLHPLVVLVNGYTASASEITSGAIQDYHAGTIVGTRTFGKGVVQSLFPLPGGGALKITIARYLTPSGRSIQHHGIEPDVVVPQSPDPALFGTPRDRQLAVAERILARASAGDPR